MVFSGIAAEKHEGRPLRCVLKELFSLSTGQFKRAKFDGCILLNGQPVHVSAVVHSGDEISVSWEERALPQEVITRRETMRNASVPPLQVLYEDEQLLVIDKPAPMPSVASPRQEGITVEEMLLNYLQHPKDFVYRPVNRLDKGTSGLMMIAKTAWLQQRMQALLHTEAFCREYLAVCEGVPDPAEGKIALPIGKEEGASIRRIILPPESGGKDSLTCYRVLKQNGARALVRLQLLTGRTHQIRVHLSSIGCPVCGDFLYGRELESLPGRFALHSAYLIFTHPQSGKRISLESPLPEELGKLLTNCSGN